MGHVNIQAGEQSSGASPILEPGRVLDGFRIESAIGFGGMAIVYRAEQLSLGRQVALKVLAAQLTDDSAFRERFRREGEHAAALEHPNIIPVYDCGEVDGLLFLAMRLVDGPTLAKVIGSNGLTIDQTFDVMRAVADALDFAHDAELVHRDVKPQNVLLTDKGHPYLADFGIAKSSGAHGLTAAGGFVGTVDYASPEQIRGKPLTAASDIYSLTGVLYQCLAGRAPYGGESQASVMHAHLNQPPPAISAVAAPTADLDRVIAKGMAKNQDDRYARAGDLLADAAAAVTHMPGTTRLGLPTSSDQMGDSAAAEVLEDASKRAKAKSAGARTMAPTSTRRPHRLQRLALPAGGVLALAAAGGALLLSGHGTAGKHPATTVPSGAAHSTDLHTTATTPATTAASSRGVSHPPQRPVRRHRHTDRVKSSTQASKTSVATDVASPAASVPSTTTTVTAPASSPSTDTQHAVAHAAPPAKSHSAYGPTVVAPPVE